MKPSIILLTVLITLFVIPGMASAATIHVPGDHANIQDAIDAAANGDTVIVGPGSYVENLDFKGKAITVESSHGTKSTIIDGNDAGTAVTFQTSEGPDSVLDGFGIKNGLATNGGGIACLGGAAPTIINNHLYINDAASGAAIYCEGGSPVIRRNILSVNKATSNGGGICCLSASPTIEHNKILGNIALNFGGGIHCDASAGVINGNILEGNGYGNTGGGISCVSGSNPLIANNLIDDNVTNLWCGGILCQESDPLITGNVIKDNQTANGGGGIYVFNNAAPLITCNMIHGNFGNYWGGGVLCQMNASPTLTNNTIVDNYAKYGGALNVEDSSAVIANGILWNNGALVAPEIFLDSNATVTISYSDLQGGQASCYVTSGSTLNWGTAMIDTDPLFVDSMTGDLHLFYTSPCRDVGDSGAPSLPSEDFEGDPCPALSAPDLGADEFHDHLYYTGNATPGGTVAVKIVGMPGTAQVALIVGRTLIDPPVSGAYGDWYVGPPMLIINPLPAIPADGLEVYPGNLPPTPTSPYTLYLQAMLDNQLTNLCTMEVD